MNAEGIVFVVDDDARIRDSLQSLLHAVGHEVRLYDDAESFLAGPRPNLSCCAILDLNLGLVSGLDVHRCATPARVVAE
jgi:FixJ family two-component response regulator